MDFLDDVAIKVPVLYENINLFCQTIAQNKVHTRPLHMTVIAIDHIQIAMPAGEESLAREFYGEILGIPEISKPSHLVENGGVWFEAGPLKIHLGIDPEFVPARKAHPGLLVADLELLRKNLESNGYVVSGASSLPGFRRIFTSDPFGNRIEFLQVVTTFDAKYSEYS